MMKKHFLGAVALGLSCCFFNFTPQVVYAQKQQVVHDESFVDYMTEPKAVASDVNVIYTMYLGMSENDFKTNFANVKGWKKMNLKTRDTYVYRKGKPGYDEVVEYIRAAFVNEKLVSMEVVFLTSSNQIRNTIFDDMHQAIKSQLGTGDSVSEYAIHWFPDNHSKDIGISSFDTIKWEKVDKWMIQNFAENINYRYMVELRVNPLVLINTVGC